MTDVPVAAWIGLTVAASAAFGGLAPVFARRCAPRTAAWLLSLGSLVLAASGVGTLGLVVVPAAAQLPAVAALGHWSARWLHVAAPEHHAAVVASALLVVLAGLLVRTTWRWGRALHAAWSASRGLAGPLVVVADPVPNAYALPGWPGRIVATTGLLQEFDPPERRAVLAHEQAHLDARHDLHLAIGALAAAVDPLLVRVPAALQLATERWADERAATATGDRVLVARTIGRAAEQLSAHARSGAFTLAIAAGDVPARVTALLAGAPRRQPLAGAALAALIIAGAGAALLVAFDIDGLFDAAARAYRVAHPAH